MSFEQDLAEALESAKKVAVVGIGNELNGDDGFGVLVARKLGNFGRCVSIQAHTVPENFISKIAGEKPSHVIFLDAAAMNAPPGTLELLQPGDLARIATVTHRIPLSKLVERLSTMCECRILIIGMQPKSMDVGAELSAEAQSAMNKLIHRLRDNLS